MKTATQPAFSTRVTLAALLCAAGALSQAHAAGSVEVQWLKPDTYTDAGRSHIERDRVLHSLGEYLQRLGPLLPDGQLLQLEVTDLDLAGAVEPLRWRDVRVLRGGADWPRMNLRYTLSANGRTLQRGEAQLQDMGYLFGIGAALRQPELGYEKHMIEQWFKAEFVTPRR